MPFIGRALPFVTVLLNYLAVSVVNVRSVIPYATLNSGGPEVTISTRFHVVITIQLHIWSVLAELDKW